MNWWQFMLVMMLVLPVMVLGLGCIMDIITRPDYSGLAKAAWMLFVILLPLFGALAYVITRPPTISAYPPGVSAYPPGVLEQAYQEPPYTPPAEAQKTGI